MFLSNICSSKIVYLSSHSRNPGLEENHNWLNWTNYFLHKSTAFCQVSIFEGCEKLIMLVFLLLKELVIIFTALEENCDWLSIDIDTKSAMYHHVSHVWWFWETDSVGVPASPEKELVIIFPVLEENCGWFPISFFVMPFFLCRSTIYHHISVFDDVDYL